MNEKGVSYVMWNLSNKDESSAMIAPSVTSISNWSEEELSESGRWAVQMMNNRLAQYIPSEQSNPQSGSMMAPNFEFTSDMITVTAEKTNSWEGEQKQYTQYKFAVKNKEVYTISDWNMTVHFDQDIEVDQIWNATAEIRGEYLVITPQIYNATIAAGETMDTIGVIVVSSSESNILGVE